MTRVLTEPETAVSVIVRATLSPMKNAQEPSSRLMATYGSAMLADTKAGPSPFLHTLRAILPSNPVNGKFSPRD